MHLDALIAISKDLEAVKRASGKDAKTEAARKWSTPDHVRILDLIGNRDLVFYVTWDSVLKAVPGGVSEWDDIWYEASARVATPSQTAARVRGLLAAGYPENVLKAIVEKTPDCGLSISGFKKARGQSSSFLISLANSWTDFNEAEQEELLQSSEYYTTPKMDGLRSLWVLIPGSECVLSRKMKPLKNQEHILKELMRMFDGLPGVVDGEALAKDNSWNSSVTATKNSGEGSKIPLALHAFDFIPAEEFLNGTYTTIKKDRLAILNSRMEYGELFTRVPFIRVRSAKQVREYLEVHLNSGFEGSVLHDMRATYRPKPNLVENRTDAIIKVKKWLSSEFTITNVIPGTGKHLGRMGSILVEGTFRDQFIRSEVGTGFSDAERASMWNAQRAFIGRKAEIKFFQATEDGSLRFPSFLRIREDLE